MDDLDVKILWDMGLTYHMPNGPLDRRPSPNAVADHLRVDPNTIRSRINRMEREGFIKSYQLFPNLNSFGLSCTAYALFFSDVVKKKEAIRKLKSMDEVLRIDECIGSVGVTLLYDTQSSLVRKLQLLKDLTGVEPLKVYDVEMPTIHKDLSETDWQIMRSLRYDALKKPKAISEELGITTRTVNNRLQRMIRLKALFVGPMLSTAKFSDAILQVLVTYFTVGDSVGRTIQEATNPFNQRVICKFVDLKGAAVMMVILASSMAEVERNYSKVQSTRGVTRVVMDYLLDSHDCSQHFDKLIEGKILAARRERIQEPMPRVRGLLPKSLEKPAGARAGRQRVLESAQ